MAFCLLLAGSMNGQTCGFFQKHERAGTKTELRNSSRQRGELSVFPLLSGTAVNNLVDKQVARPTTIFRETSWDTKVKYECQYDAYGHITSLKTYYYTEQGNDSEEHFENVYVLQDSIVNEYHQLPNGEFVKTKEEYANNSRYTSAYDDKGMLLWRQIEF
jgi:hypothetical protein